MADKKVLEFEVPGTVINSYKDLKKAIKDATDEQIKASEKFGATSAEAKKAAKNVAELKDKVEDLADSSRSLKGSGIERSAQGFSQLGEGLRNLDLDKVKVGLTAIKSALAATGIMLLVQGVMYLIENFNELSKGSGLLGTVLRFVGNIVEGLKDALYELTDAMGATNSAMDKFSESVTKSFAVGNEELAKFQHLMDNNIKLAKANGEETIKYEKAKQDAIIVTNKLIVEQMIALVRAGGKLNEEQQKQLSASLQLIKDANIEKQVLEVNHNKKVNDDLEKSNLEKQAKIKKDFEEYKKGYKDLDDYRRKLEEEFQAYLHQNALNDRARLEAKTEETKYFDDDATTTIISNYDKKTEASRAHSEAEQANTAAALEVAKMSFDSQAQLANFLFDLKRSKAKKGSEEDLKAAKKQFQLNKALAIQSSIISGIQGVINALSAQSVIPEPFGTILKVATAVGVGIAATVNTAKIASQQFNEGGGGGGDSAASTGSVGAAASAPPPTMTTPQNTPPSTTQFDDKGKNMSLKVTAEVVSTKMTEQQERDQKFKAQSTF